MADTLSYAPRTRWTFVRKNRRRLTVLFVSIVIAALSYRYRTQAYEFFAWRYYFWQCMDYGMPQGRFKLHNSNAAYSWLVARIEADLGSDSIQHVSAPIGWTSLCALDRRTDWVGGHLFLTFLGNMQRPDGQQRLVIIGGDVVNAYTLQEIDVLVLRPPGLFQRPPQVSWQHGIVYHGPDLEAMLEPAQRDHADSSHLIIPFNVRAGPKNYSRCMIDAYLQNDDSLLLQLRDEVPLLGKRKYVLPGGPSPALQTILKKDQEMLER